MRLVTIDNQGEPAVAVERESGRHLLSAPAGAGLGDVGDLLRLSPADREQALGAAHPEPAPSDARLLAPLQPRNIVAIGLNYADHIKETGMDAPQRPLVFSKLTSSVVGPSDEIQLDGSLTSQADWEVELAVVIGRTARRLPREQSLDAVFGYTVANDVSARDLQFGDGQWIRGKSLDTFCPLGPAVVTPDEIGDPQHLALRTRVNGALVQDSNTAEMIFPVAELISFCSHSFTLRPGDVILTGTPWGCGAFMDPPRFLAPGDVVETQVEGIGTLRNVVRAA
jgi:2-keto-4-pentenoate hydratase/2-oxohepta-3-ene-1,7-dioic acid hydratase in catechol pathway